jgi:D-3-phosphoglycerate dehydrogenase
MSKVLVSDPIDQVGIDILSQVAQVDVKTGLSPEDWCGSCQSMTL